MKIAFLTDAPRVAGSETWLLSYLPTLKQNGFDPILYLSSRPSLDDYARRIQAAGVGIQRYKKLEEIAPTASKADLRVIQAWNAQTYTWSFSHLPGPNLAIIHDQLEFHYPLGLKYLYRFVYHLSKARALHKANAVITVSKWGAELLRSLGLPRVFTVRNGVDVQRFKPRPESRSKLRSDFAFNRFTVLIPGRMSPEKNPLAALLTARLCPHLDFVFVGDDDSVTGKAVKYLARKYGVKNVRFWGKRWDMPELYAAVDAVMLPTLAENQSLATLESMASGVPVVTSNIPAQAELILDQIEGLLVPPKPPLLAKALNTLACDTQKTAAMGRAARERVLKQHTLDLSTSELIKAILNALKTA
ncbi:lipopolysaccharide biosynthesis protein [Meiothermus taiwanensis]|nr:lipopolysaccharide biosynthesis protein [Meiothermus taiwanensis]